MDGGGKGWTLFKACVRRLGGAAFKCKKLHIPSTGAVVEMETFIRGFLPLWTARKGTTIRNGMRGTCVRVEALRKLLISRSPRLEISKRTIGETIAHALLEYKSPRGTEMIDLNAIKITPRDGEVLKLLAQGCSNKEIAGQLQISPRTVKQHLRTLFLRAGITEGRKRVKLATAVFAKEQSELCNPAIS